MGYMRKLLRQHNALNGWQNPKVLDVYNDTLDDKYLHPTKGYRHVSTKRTRIAILKAQMKDGSVPWGMSIIKRELETIDA